MAIRGKALAQLEEARRSPESRWILSLVGGIAQREILEGAQQRLRALGADEALIRAAGDPNHAVPSAAPAPAAKTTAANALDPGANAESAAAAPEVAAAVQDDGLLARWWSRRVERMEANAAAIERDPDTMIRLFLGALPGALFLLVPLFALLLKLVHVRSGRGYLEHLVVALYSHAFMLAALLLVFLLIGARGLSAAPLWQGMLALASTALLLIGIPLYLLLMQKRVYAQGWFRTLAKYGVLGVCYGFLLLLGIVYAVLAGLSS
jgi:hypothetical protein